MRNAERRKNVHAWLRNQFHHNRALPGSIAAAGPLVYAACRTRPICLCSRWTEQSQMTVLMEAQYCRGASGKPLLEVLAQDSANLPMGQSSISMQGAMPKAGMAG